MLNRPAIGHTPFCLYAPLPNRNICILSNHVTEDKSPIRYANDVAVGADGTVYFSDSSIVVSPVNEAGTFVWPWFGCLYVIVGTRVYARSVCATPRAVCVLAARAWPTRQLSKNTRSHYELLLYRQLESVETLSKTFYNASSLEDLLTMPPKNALLSHSLSRRRGVRHSQRVDY